MRKLILILFLFLLSFNVYSQTYFRINVPTGNKLFYKLLFITGLEREFPDKYQLVVNLAPDSVLERSKEPFFVIGKSGKDNVEFDPNAYRYDWKDLSLTMQRGILDYEHNLVKK